MVSPIAMTHFEIVAGVEVVAQKFCVRRVRDQLDGLPTAV
jgi:hypothetical protein